MNRRQWLAAAGASAGFLGMAEFARGGAARRAGAKRLAEAWELARARGKPLLVIPAPADRALGQKLGLLWGQVFALGDERALADLALCELVCVPVEEVARGMPHEQGGERDAQARATELEGAAAVLHETGGHEPVTSVLQGWDLLPPDSCSHDRADHAARTRCAALAQRLRAVIAPDAEACVRRGRGLDSGAFHEDLVRTLFATNLRPRLESVDRLAAFYHPLSAHHEDDAAREYWAGMLAQAVLLRLWEQDPVGARWRVTELDPCPPCGLGFVPDSSRNFLDLYTS